MAVKPLVLVLDGQTDRLKAALRAGTSDLMNFSKSTEEVMGDLQEKVRSSMEMSGADLADRMTRNIQKQVAGWKRGAEAALAMGNDYNPLGGMNSAKTLEAAAAQDRLAASYREQAAAAAAATGADKIEDVVLRQLATSSALAAEEAHRRAEELRVQANVFATVERQMGITVNTQNRLTQMSGATRNAMRDLSYQVSDVATSLAGGMPPAMVFSQQFGQIVGALQMMEGEGNAVVRFLGGPWGMAFATAAVAIIPLVAHLLDAKGALEENAEALAKVKAGDDGLSEAQGVLGKMFDLTTGKLKEQNEMLRLNAILTMNKLRAEAAAEKHGSDKVLNDTANSKVDALSTGSVAKGVFAAIFGSSNPDTKNLADMANVDDARRRGNELQNIARQVASGKMSGSDAVKWAGKFNFEGLRVNQADFSQAMSDMDSAPMKLKIAQEIEDSLKNGVLATGLRQTGRPKKDHTAERQDDYEAKLASARAEQLKWEMDATKDIEARAELEKQAVDQRLQAKLAENKKLKVNHDELDALEKGNAQTEKDAIDAKMRQDLTARDLTTQENSLRFANQMLEVQGQLAPTLKERLGYLRRVLDNEKEAAILAVKKDVNAGKLTGDEGAAKIAEIQNLYTAKGEALDKANAAPMAAYKQHLLASTADMNASLQSVQVNGLKGLEDGLVGIVSGTETAASAFKRMAASIIADLARIAIEQAFVKVLGFGLASGGKVPARASGGLLGYAAGGTRLGSGMISGPGSGTSDSILALVNGKDPVLVSNGEGIVNERAVRQYWPLIDAMNKGTFPRYAGGGLLSAAMASLAYPAIPSARSLAPMGQTVHQYFSIDAKGAILANELMDTMTQISARHASAALAAAPGLTQQQMQQRAEQRIPG